MRTRILGILAAGWCAAGLAHAQTVAKPTSTANANSAAAIVNGLPIAEITVQRALRRFPPDKHSEVRKDIVDQLVDNALIEQYLVQQKVVVEPKEVQTRLVEFQAELQKQKRDLSAMMKEMNLTDEEMRYQIAADLRWEKYVLAKVTEPMVQEMYQKNQARFDGTKVRARHILIRPNGQSVDVVKAQLNTVRKEVFAAGDAAAARAPANDKMAVRGKAIEEAFIKAAERMSQCPSKQNGGDLEYFPGTGAMVEPFAKAAFALKPFEVSEVVATQYGLHLIMATGRKAGEPTTFEKVKEIVQEVCYDQFREQLCAQLRATAKINIK